jgi:hypothetical protein
VYQEIPYVMEMLTLVDAALSGQTVNWSCEKQQQQNI